MENIVSKYQSRTRKRHTASVVATSLALAVAANLFMFSQVGRQMAASVLDTAPAAQAAGDIYLARSQGAPEIAVLTAGRAMAQVKELSFTVSADPSRVTLRSVVPADGVPAEVTMITKEAPYVVTLRFARPTDLPAGKPVATISLAKKGTETTAVNLVSTFFKGDKAYELTNAGLSEF